MIATRGMGAPILGYIPVYGMGAASGTPTPPAAIYAHRRVMIERHISSSEELPTDERLRNELIRRRDDEWVILRGRVR